ncbi:MAG: hypothetical protein SNJ59_03815 [Aggregatilineales bacterium]
MRRPYGFPNHETLLALLFTTLVLIHFAPRQTAGQPITPPSARPHQVFIEHGDPDRLIFVDLLTGEEQAVSSRGERYTIYGGEVLFFDADRRQMMIAGADGRLRPHTFIQPGREARRIDWAISSDEQMIAWTITTGTPSALRTTTYVADSSGAASARPVFSDGPHDGIRAYPVAFNRDRNILYMDYQPDFIADFTPFRQHASLFSLDLDSGAIAPLPGEPGCFCGAGIGGGRFLRLMLAAEGGFDLRVVDLDTDLAQTIRGLGLAEYTQGGDVLLAPDGARAVYTLARVRGFGTAQQMLETVFILVDLVTMSQRILFETDDLFLRPVTWTDDDSAILLISPTAAGTWKLSVPSGELSQVASATYLGTMMPAQGGTS